MKGAQLLVSRQEIVVCKEQQRRQKRKWSLEQQKSKKRRLSMTSRKDKGRPNNSLCESSLLSRHLIKVKGSAFLPRADVFSGSTANTSIHLSRFIPNFFFISLSPLLPFSSLSFSLSPLSHSPLHSRFTISLSPSRSFSLFLCSLPALFLFNIVCYLKWSEHWRTRILGNIWLLSVHICNCSCVLLNSGFTNNLNDCDLSSTNNLFRIPVWLKGQSSEIFIPFFDNDG